MVNPTVVIIGAGPVGLLTALYLAQRVDCNNQLKYPTILIIEKRGDLRKTEPLNESKSKEYNVVISSRGFEALNGIPNLLETINSSGVLYSRMQNCIKTDNLSEGYVSHTEKEKLSIGRNQVVLTLLNFIEKYPQIEIIFDKTLIDVDFETNKVLAIPSFKSIDNIDKAGLDTFSFDILIGADGAKTNVGHILKNKTSIIINSFLPHSEPYVSTQINHEDLEKENIKFHKKSMYTIQPSWQAVSLILLPNPASVGAILNFECQLNGDSKKHCLHTLKDSQQLYDFFIKAFPHLGKILYKSFAPKLGITDHYSSKQPIVLPNTTYLTTEYSQFYHPKRPVIILGDAAHTMPPTIGQGINCGFIDVKVLNNILDENNDNWEIAPKLFNSSRKPETEAIQKLSQLYLTERKSNLFGLRLGLDIGRSILLKKFPKGWVQPSVNQLLSQTTVPYVKVLQARQRHLITGCTVLVGVFCSFGTALYYKLKR